MLNVCVCVCECVSVRLCARERESTLRQLCGRGVSQGADIQILMEEYVEVIQESDSLELVDLSLHCLVNIYRKGNRPVLFIQPMKTTPESLADI